MPRTIMSPELYPAAAGTREGRPRRVAGRGGASSEVDDDRLHLRVFRDAFVATFAAEAGFLEAAEGDLVRVAGGVVGADEPVLEALRHAHHPRHVARVEVRREAELGRVGALDHLVLALEGEDGRGRDRKS